MKHRKSTTKRKLQNSRTIEAAAVQYRRYYPGTFSSNIAMETNDVEEVPILFKRIRKLKMHNHNPEYFWVIAVCLTKDDSIKNVSTQARLADEFLDHWRYEIEEVILDYSIQIILSYIVIGKVFRNGG
jgi:hypothetical protein